VPNLKVSIPSYDTEAGSVISRVVFIVRPVLTAKQRHLDRESWVRERYKNLKSRRINEFGRSDELPLSRKSCRYGGAAADLTPIGTNATLRMPCKEISESSPYVVYDLHVLTPEARVSLPK